MPTLLLLLGLALCGCTANDDVHPPFVGAITPERGRPGSTAIISGDYFCAQPDPEFPDDVDPLACETMGVVTFDMIPATAIRYTDEEIIVEVPQLPPGRVAVEVAVAGRDSDGIPFIVE